MNWHSAILPESYKGNIYKVTHLSPSCLHINIFVPLGITLLSRYAGILFRAIAIFGCGYLLHVAFTLQGQAAYMVLGVPVWFVASLTVAGLVAAPVIKYAVRPPHASIKIEDSRIYIDNELIPLTGKLHFEAVRDADTEDDWPAFQLIYKSGTNIVPIPQLRWPDKEKYRRETAKVALILNMAIDNLV